MKKVRVTVPYLMRENLKNDEIHFKLPIGAIGNRIFCYYTGKKITKINLKADGGEIIQFNLNNSNSEIFIETLKEQEFTTEADYLRNIFYDYLNKPICLREEILYSNLFSIIKSAIKNFKKIKIIYGNDKESRVVNPYFIKVADIENKNYLFCWCEKNCDFRCYKISQIKNAYEALSAIEIKNDEFIKKIEKNFDPFLSYGEEVKVSFSKKGLKILGEAIANRPKVLNRDEEKSIYTFQCSRKLAEAYFTQFFSEIKILEPLELREWFRKEFEKGLMKYL